MKRKIAVVSLMCFLTVLANWLWSFVNSKDAFVKDWISTFNQCKTVSRIQNLPRDKRPDLIVVRRFPDQQWVAAVADSTCSRAGGWDAAVFYDSRGRLHQTEHHFCGYEGLTDDINRIKANSLAEFYTQSNSFELKPVK